MPRCLHCAAVEPASRQSSASDKACKGCLERMNVSVTTKGSPEKPGKFRGWPGPVESVEVLGLGCEAVC